MPYIQAYGDSNYLLDTPRKMLQADGQAIPSIRSFEQGDFEEMLRLYIDTLVSFNRVRPIVNPRALEQYGSSSNHYQQFLDQFSPFRMETAVLCNHLEVLKNVLSAFVPERYVFQDVEACVQAVDQFRRSPDQREQTRRLLLVLCMLFNLKPEQLPDDYIRALQVPEAEDTNDRWWDGELVLDWCSIPNGETFCKPLINQDEQNRTLKVRIRLPDQDMVFDTTLPPGEGVWVLRAGDTPTCVLPGYSYCRNPVSRKVCAFKPDKNNRIDALGLMQVSQLGGIGATSKKPRYLRKNGSIELSDRRLQSIVGNGTDYSALFCADLAFVAVKKVGGIVTNLPELNQPGVQLLALAVKAWEPGEEYMGFVYIQNVKGEMQLKVRQAGAAPEAKNAMREVAEGLLGMFLGPQGESTC